MGKLLRHRNILRRFDSATHRDKNRRLGQVDSLLGFAEDLERLSANLRGIELDAHWCDGRF